MQPWHGILYHDVPFDTCPDGESYRFSSHLALRERHTHSDVYAAYAAAPGTSRESCDPNPYRFEMASIVRWVLVYELAKRMSFSRFVFVDCDVLVFSSMSHVLLDPFRNMDSVTLRGASTNGAMPVWSLRGIAEFSHFLVQMVTRCPPDVLSSRWKVDMSLLALWRRPLLTNASVSDFGCNFTLHASGARAAYFDSSLETGYFIGSVPAEDEGSTNLTRVYAGCSASPSSKLTPRAGLVKHPDPKFVQRMAVQMVFDLGDLCSPFVMDVCSQAFVPVHMAHYTGRYKIWLYNRGPAHNRQSWSRCRCVTRSGTLHPSPITSTPSFANQLAALTRLAPQQQRSLERGE